MRDLYEILGVGHDASEEDIKRAYRRLARSHHPDAGGDEASFKELTAAYEVLKNPQTRANYDRYGDPRGPAGGMGGDPFGGFGDLNDLIDSFFGGFGGRGRGTTRSGRQPGRDALVDVSVTLEEASSGVRRDVDVTVLRTCDTCGGSGASPGTSRVPCTRCDGAGAVQQVTRSVFGQMLTSTVCPRCDGAGSMIERPCPECSGQGRRRLTEQVTVDVPPGVGDGTRLRLSERGEGGRHGARAGDLYVRVRVAPHDIFQRDGNDLHCEVDVPMVQAALGADLQLPTLDGDHESVRVPPGTQTGDVVTLRRRGMPRLSGGGARGNLHVHFRVRTPTDATAEQEELLRRLAELRGEDVPAHGRGLFSRLKEAFRA